jgi:hypothetical protein
MNHEEREKQRKRENLQLLCENLAQLAGIVMLIGFIIGCFLGVWGGEYG